MKSQQEFRDPAPFAFKQKSSQLIRVLIIIGLTFSSNRIFSQDAKLTETITSVAEELAADDSDPEAVTTYTERLQELAEEPVNLNSTNPDEIARLFFLSDFQVKALVDYVHSTGQIVSIYEIANIPGFDKETTEMIIPFITLKKAPTYIPDSIRCTNTLITNFSVKPGPSDTSLLGPGYKLLTKYKFIAGGFSGGFTIEKDPGEKFLAGTPPLPDFLSGYLSYSNQGIVKKLIIGDFSARFGQGTNINTGIRRGISLVSPGYMSASDELRPYTSTEENKFFRGVATELSLKYIDLSLFISKNYVDATTDKLSDSSEYIETFTQGGVHNTVSLLKKKDSVSEVAYGVMLSCNLKNLKIGLAFSDNQLSLPVRKAENPEKIFGFTGSDNQLYTTYYNFFIKKVLLYGELTLDGKNKSALIQGISIRPSDRLSIVVLLRNYSPGFTSTYGQGPGTGSNTENEKGAMACFTFEAAKHLFVSAGCDIHYSKWLKYRCSAPTSGIRKELKINYQPRDKLAFDVSYSYVLSMVDGSDTSGIPSQDQIKTRSLKYSQRYSVSENLTLVTRMDYKIADPGGSRGVMLSQDINYIFRKYPVSVWFRYCLFNTGDWASRIYAYENDMLYSLSIPALSGKGSRSYLMIKWKIGDSAELRVKYGVTSVITNENLWANTDEIKLQLKLRF